MGEIRVSIDSLCVAQGWTAESFESGLLRAADRNRDRRITAAELDQYVAAPRDGAFVSRRHLDAIADAIPLLPAETVLSAAVR